MTSNREDFSGATKERLAKRVGYRCSFPGCARHTIGPSEEGESAISSIGMACHIYSASGGVGARRVYKSEIDFEIDDFKNGIWMCYSHGKLIDTDERRYSPELLFRWKKLAEEASQKAVESGEDYLEIYKNIAGYKLLSDKIVLMRPDGGENAVRCMHIADKVDVLVKDCLGFYRWGVRASNIIIDFISEYCLNSFIHSNASYVEVEILEGGVQVFHDGSEYNPKNLLKFDSKSGGVASCRELFGELGDGLVFDYGHNEKSSTVKVSLPRNSNDISSLFSRCHKESVLSDVEMNCLNLLDMADCGAIYVTIVKRITQSEAYRVNSKKILKRADGKEIVFLLDRDSISEGVERILRDEFSDARFIVFG